MSDFSDPFPHAAAFTGPSAPFVLPVPARALILSNFAAAPSSITIQTVSGETLTLSLGTPTAATPPIRLPLQVAAVIAATNVPNITALWH